jgi:major tropism determinant Mtd-like protein
MPKQVRLRRGTTAQHASFTGAQGEVTYDTDKKTLVAHDGVTAGGKPFDRFVEKTPATVLTPQTVAGPLLLTGGDSETQGLSVTNQAGVNQLLVSKDAQIKDLRGQSFAFTYASSIDISFALDTHWLMRLSLTGNVTFTSSGWLVATYKRLKITSDGSVRTLTFPGNWKFIGAAAPANIAANKVGVLELWCDGTAETDVCARWHVQP